MSFSPSVEVGISSPLENLSLWAIGFVERFQREISIIKDLEHPHVLPVYEAGTSEDGQVYLAMRLIDGGSLADRTKKGKLDRRLAVRYLSQIAAALDFAHRREIVHRDLKPGNILLDESDNAYTLCSSPCLDSTMPKREPVPHRLLPRVLRTKRLMEARDYD